MYDYLNEVIEKNENGLYMLQLPTGTGKSYNVAKAIKNQILDKNSSRVMIYLTPLKKNVDGLEAELRKFYNDDEKFEADVLKIRSNFDTVKENIEKVVVPDEFKNKNYIELREKIKTYLSITEKNTSDDMKEKIDILEKSFRKGIQNMLKKRFKNKRQRLTAIKTDENYKWIGQLYPAVFTEKKKVLLMTVRKFIEKNSVIVEPSYNFIGSKIVKNSVIFIDEFDSTKDDIKSKIIETSIAFTNQYLQLFRNIFRVLKPENLSKDLKISYDEAVKKYGQLTKMADEIRGKYSLNLSFKTDENSKDSKQNFLFKDATFHTILDNHKNYIRTCLDTEENRVKIIFEDRESFYKNKNIDDIPIYSMLRDVNRFLRKFRGFLYLWSKNYCKLENIKRSQDQDIMSIEQAISTILSRLEFNQMQRYMMLSQMEIVASGKKSKTGINMYDIYENGFEVFEFIDDDFHNDHTDISHIKITNSPENIIAYISEIATVFGISATAEISTVTGNYNIEYLKGRLNENYHKTPVKLTEKIGAEMEKLIAKYEEKNVKIIPSYERTGLSGNNIKKKLFEILKNRQEAKKIFDHINCTGLFTEEEKDFYLNRYFKLTEAMIRFIKNRSVNSMMYISMALPKKGNPKFDQQRINDIFEKIKEVVLDRQEMEKVKLFILKSYDFDKTKQEILYRLSKGEKIFAMSTYKTIGAGQNLQYNAENLNDLADVSFGEIKKDDIRLKMKDFDCIYLSDYTNMTVNTYDNEQSITKQQLLSMVWQVEELYDSGEINALEKKNHIRLGFNKYMGKNTKYIKNEIFYTKSVNMQATRACIQAIGRISRTYLKNREIYIFLEDKLAAKLDHHEMKKVVQTPEIKAINKLLSRIENPEYTKDEKILVNNAEKISSNSKYAIMAALSKPWDSETMKIWNDFRKFVLKHPTISDIESIDSPFKQFYIYAGKKINRYYYSQNSDFDDVVIYLKDNVQKFRNDKRAKMLANTKKAAVYQVSQKDSGLDYILKFDGMKKYFKENGYATEFEKAEYIMSPVVYHNIYKGALGEAAGKFIFEKISGIKLKEIEDPEKFEYFDYMIDSETYVDFKNWKFSYLVDRNYVKQKIFEKMEKIGAKSVYVINIVSGNKEFLPTKTKDMRIIEIPSLIDFDGNINKKSVDIILGRKDDKYQ